MEERLTPFGLTKGILSDLSKEEAYGLLSQLPGDEDGVIPSAGNPTLFR